MKRIIREEQMSGCHVATIETCEYNQNKVRCWDCRVNEQLQFLTEQCRSFALTLDMLHEYKIRQIDENRKISSRVHKLNSEMNVFLSRLIQIEEELKTLNGQ